jgi:beta-ribofuranosylaminobenzene 5'-phosphate synthase
MPKLILEVPSRLHVSLIDMSRGGYRRHGGIGFAITEGYRCEAARASKTLVVDCRSASPSNQRQRQILESKLQAVSTSLSLGAIKFIIRSGFDAHGGFGSGTALTLAAVEALHVLNEIQYTEEMIVTASGRGGVSGLGVRTYFSGGLWTDVGVPNNKLSPFLSSDQISSVNRQSTALMRFSMPDWAVGICLPLAETSTSREVENQFFANFSGANEGEVESLVYQIFMGIIPAVVENDHSTFSVALDRIQQTYWKAAERSLHTSNHAVEQRLRATGVIGIGMSSVGPGIFFLDPSAEHVSAVLNGEHAIAKTILARTTNVGRKLSYA